MSRSLRTRPLTLYDNGDGTGTSAASQHDFGGASGRMPAAGPGGAVPNYLARKSSRRQQSIYQQQDVQQQLTLSPTSHLQDGTASPGAPKENSGRRMSTAIGNNLRKRLSMRYAEPTALGPGGLSAVPSMPAMPPQFGGGASSSSSGFNAFKDGAASVEGPGMAGIGLRAGRGLPTSISVGDNLQADSIPEQQPALHHHQYQHQTQQPHTSALPENAQLTSGQVEQDLNRRAGGWERLERSARNPAVDLNLLTKSKFDPEAYLRATLNNHSEEGLREFQSTLESTQAAAHSDLRRIIFRNYKDFINISKEVSTLENDTLELKELLAEWRQLPDALQLVDNQEATSKQRKGMSESSNDTPHKAYGNLGTSNRQMNSNHPSRVLNDLTDDLAVKIALREWESAADLVEKGKEMLATISHSDPEYMDLSSMLSRRISELVAAVSLSLSAHLSKKSIVVSNASIMLRLGQGERARELFLEARTELLRKRTRMIKFEGDVSLYISELALVYFTLIKNTSEWYMSAFKDNWMASGYVKWAAAQIQAYAEIFRRQVYGVADQDRRVVQEALEITRSSSAQLKEVGLDFGFLIEELLRPAGLERPIPSLTLTLPDESMSSAHGHRASYMSNSSTGLVAKPTGKLISAQERRRTIMLAAGGVIPGI
ncbi:unnamed protein product [Tilletia controversa]|uniref:Exocyst component Exo84 C-terminal domain-containing protein n=3 Tax=Tilletia TaxID=13289 RepID=A0A8X7MXS8_9BASI|nr:hypothetical protein CF336_g2237 [Tilletia laevis]KAE8200031.1 hypothetical protein CF328_g3079 [Tilletia controversa]KAE8262577.1 hypothetical protein A4X03_0g2352 [Tilletia caries]KAE8205761.1 hypothetical protein CF335_g2196 [Tilletia laevis]KAE8252314.1 hypothetical protein A4X06_0g2277 [Tilletia controversa]